MTRVSFRKLSKGGGAIEGICILRGGGGGGGMMIIDVTKFHKCHLGGRGMLECVCVCRVSYRIWGFGRGRRTPKFGVDVEGVYCT